MVKTPPFHGGITGSNPVGVILIIWRITQVRLKGSVLKTDRRLIACGGSNPSSSLKFITSASQVMYKFIVVIAGWSSWQLVGLIIRRS